MIVEPLIIVGLVLANGLLPWRRLPLSRRAKVSGTHELLLGSCLCSLASRLEWQTGRHHASMPRSIPEQGVQWAEPHGEQSQMLDHH